MTAGWFVSGTDTGVGKSLVAVGLLRALARAGRRAVGMKPVASGCRTTPAGLRCDDAEALIAAAAVAADYDDVNPYAFAPPVAPHLAAAAAGVEIRLDTIAERFRRLARHAGHVVVEGAGGVLVPLGATQVMADIPLTLGLPVVLVVALRLGCLNHALLSAEALDHRGLRLAGWVANCTQAGGVWPEANIAALRERLAAPLLGVVPYLRGRRRDAVSHLDISPLLVPDRPENPRTQ